MPPGSHGGVAPLPFPARGVAGKGADARLDDDEKMQVVDPATRNNNPGTGINDLLNMVNEPGLYRLILTSRKPEAKAFKRWVIHGRDEGLRCWALNTT